MQSPCMECKERKFNCHSNCDKYKSFIEEKQRENVVRRSTLEKTSLFYDARRNRVRRDKYNNMLFGGYER